MKIGVMSGAPGTHHGPTITLDELVAFARKLEQLNLDSLWLAHIWGLHSMSALAVVGYETKTIHVGTAVIPAYFQHPVTLAQDALTVSTASKGRFHLGIGLSHKVVVEDRYGLSYDRPAEHIREVLQIILPLLSGKEIQHRGNNFNVAASLVMGDTSKIPVLVAALGPVMLRLTGQIADGTITWMCGPRTLEEHIIPTMNQGARECHREAPRTVAGFPIALTKASDLEKTRDKISKSFKRYAALPSYRAMLDNEGVNSPADVAMIGDENVLRLHISRLRDIGVTDFNGFVVADDEINEDLTLKFLASEVSSK